MLMQLLREYVRPYRRAVLYVLGLQLVGTIAALYLPALNADIIDNGVVRGDTSYIIRLGPSTSARGRRWAPAATSVRRSSGEWASSPVVRSPISALLR